MQIFVQIIYIFFTLNKYLTMIMKKVKNKKNFKSPLWHGIFLTHCTTVGSLGQTHAPALAGPCLFTDNNRNLCTLSWSSRCTYALLSVTTSYLQTHHCVPTDTSSSSNNSCDPPTIIAEGVAHKVCAHFICTSFFRVISKFAGDWDGTPLQCAQG